MGAYNIDYEFAIEENCVVLQSTFKEFLNQILRPHMNYT